VDPDAAAGSLDEVGPGRADMLPLDPTWSNLIQPDPTWSNVQGKCQLHRILSGLGSMIVGILLFLSRRSAGLRVFAWKASTKAEDSARFRSPEGS
jgi:hypothetical protein